MDKDGKLIYLEFCNMICPKKDEYSKLLRSRQTKVSHDAKKMSIETELLLVKLLKSFLENEIQLENSKQKLTNEINFMEVFDAIKNNDNLQYFTIDDVSLLKQTYT